MSFVFMDFYAAGVDHVAFVYLNFVGKSYIGAIEAGVSDRENERGGWFKDCLKGFKERLDISDVHESHVADSRIEVIFA